MKEKLNHMPINIETRSELIRLVPYGLVATKSWLTAQGLSRHSIDNFVKSRQLVAVSRGVYRRSETRLGWQGIVASLQRMESDLTVGGMSALGLHGLAHYVPLTSGTIIHLYGTGRLPVWIEKISADIQFIQHSIARLFTRELHVHSKFGQNIDTAIGVDHTTHFTSEFAWGDNQHPLTVSLPERAILEVLQGVPKLVSFEHADQLMQGMTSLSPRRMDKLLKRVKSVKVTRLFFWLADRHQHQWRKKLSPDDYSFGSGKRVLAVSGKLDTKYLITVPESMHG